MAEKLKEICRLCLMDEGELEHIFQSDENKYCEKVKEYIGFEIVQNDKLPCLICKTCSSDLLSTVNFIEKCRNNNEKLQKALEVIAGESDVKDCFIKDEKFELVMVKEEDEPLDEIGNDDDYYSEDSKPIAVKKRKRCRNNMLIGGQKCGKKIKCDTCGLLVNNVASMIAHHRTHTGERPFKCSECDKSFGLKGTMIEHFNRLHRKNDYLASTSCICDICGKKCYKKNDLKVHMRTHTKEKPYSCKYCSQSFSQTASLSEHVRVHVGERSFSCHMCGKCFLRKTSLRRHLQVHNNLKSYSCHLCNKSMKSSQALKTHLELHTSEKTHICEVCGASFAQKGNLKSHIMSKHSEKSGECKICKRVYSDLLEHNRKHSGEKPFSCEFCPKRFVCERSVKVHMKWHTETNKYPCKSCSATFPTNRQLEYHILKVHEKYAPYVCKLCSKGYYRESDLKQHKLSSCKAALDVHVEESAILVISSALVDS